MPRKTKEQKALENEKIEEKVAKPLSSTTSKKATQKATKKNDIETSKKVLAKKEKTVSNKNTVTKKNSSKNTKKLVNEKTEAKSVTTRKSNAQKASSKKTDMKKNTKTNAKKTTPKKSVTKNSSTSRKTTSKKSASSKNKIDVVEYYDLPYRYNQTIVKVLAQTPTNLFIYWDISDEDRENYKKQYGENFFETTKPVLIIYNDTLGYNFEIDINDFANSWYLHVNDAKCDYRIELGRRPISYNEKINTDYIYISTSNEIEAPNDKILFNKQQQMVYFRNVKTGVQTSKFISNISFIRNMGKIYNIYDLYKQIYQNENIEEIYNLSNPSSGNPSSQKKGEL